MPCLVRRSDACTASEAGGLIRLWILARQFNLRRVAPAWEAITPCRACCLGARVGEKSTGQNPMRWRSSSGHGRLGNRAGN